MSPWNVPESEHDASDPTVFGRAARGPRRPCLACAGVLARARKPFSRPRFKFVHWFLMRFRNPAFSAAMSDPRAYTRWSRGVRTHAAPTPPAPPSTPPPHRQPVQPRRCAVAAAVTVRCGAGFSETCTTKRDRSRWRANRNSTYAARARALRASVRPHTPLRTAAHGRTCGRVLPAYGRARAARVRPRTCCPRTTACCPRAAACGCLRCVPPHP